MKAGKNGIAVAGFGTLNCDILYSGMPRLPEEGQEIYASGLDVQLGGGPAATLTVLSRLKVPTLLLTLLGEKSFFADFLRQKLDEAGVTYKDLHNGKGIPFCISSAMITESDRTFASYIGAHELDKAQESEVKKILIDTPVVLMNGGKIEMYREIRQKNPDSILVWDTGWKDDLSLKNYEEYLILADYYTPNLPEALQITGETDPILALRVLRKYFKYPIIKMGKNGCLFMKEEGIYCASVLPGIKAVDSTGAGDAFLGGFLYGICHEKEIADCVRFGNVTGGICVSEIGCLKGSVSEEKLLMMAEQVHLEKVGD